MKVPFFNYPRQYQNHRERYLEILDNSLSSGQFLLGKEVTEFENIIAQNCQRQYAVSFASATDALLFQLLASGIQPGDEVLLSSVSFLSTASTIAQIGAVPKFVDIDPNYFSMDLEKLEQHITGKTKAILAVQVFGQLMDSEKLLNIAEKNGLKVLEDDAQAYGAEDNGRPAGNLGLSSVLSFDPSKVVGCFGTCGMVVTNDDEVNQKLLNLRRHGKTDAPIAGMMDFNSLLPSAMAAILSLKIGFFETELKRRQEIADYYHERLGDLPLDLAQLRPGSTTNWHKYIVTLEKRDQLKVHLQSKGVESKIHYATPLYHLKFSPEQKKAGAFPIADRFCTRCLSLPMYTELQDQEVEHVVDSVRSFFH